MDSTTPVTLVSRLMTLVTFTNFIILFSAYVFYKFLAPVIRYRVFSPLKDYPGPFWASVTRLWSAWQQARGMETARCWELVKKHGPVVRVSPTMLLVSDAESLPLIYHRTAVKAKYYITGSFGTVETLFNIQPHAQHAHHRKLVAAPYSFSKISKTEPLVDEQILYWLNKLDERFARSGNPFNFAPWSVFVAYDIISAVGFGKALGFVEKGEDIGGLIAGFHDGLFPMGLMARLYPAAEWIKSTWMAKYLIATPEDKNGMGILLRWRDKIVDDRIQEIAEGKKMDRVDLLQAFMDARDSQGKPLEDLYVRAEALLVLLAGSDTTGTAFGAILTYILSSPTVYARMMNEIDAAISAGLLSSPIPHYAEVAAHCPFYVACVKESMRLCPSAPSIFPRVVTADQPPLIIHGKVIPVGTEVTSHTWIVHRDPKLYGEDAEEFRPERWLESTEKTKAFDKGNFVFGYGSRACLGKDLAMMELFKTPLMFFRTFTPKLCEPSKEMPGPPVPCVLGGVAFWKDIWLTIEKRKI